jgi:hypothetical protein
MLIFMGDLRRPKGRFPCAIEIGFIISAVDGNLTLYSISTPTVNSVTQSLGKFGESPIHRGGSEIKCEIYGAK